jgi:multidrug efflux pump
VNFVIQTSDSYENLNRVVRQMLDEIAKNPGIVLAGRRPAPEQAGTAHRRRPRQGGRPGRERRRGRQGDRNHAGRPPGDPLQARRRAVRRDRADQASGRTTPEDIDGIYVRGRNDTMIPLSALVKVRESVSPRELNHFGQRRSVSITANLAPDYSLGQALQFMNDRPAKVLKPGYTTDLNGTSREFRNSQGALAIVFVLALLFIFLVLAAQFESFVDPLVIMLSVPLSMIGALLALKWSGGSLNVYSQIGLITLVGLITKHGILIVEFANQLREQGWRRSTRGQGRVAAPAPHPDDHRRHGAGRLPLALATGAGAESRSRSAG